MGVGSDHFTELHKVPANKEVAPIIPFIFSPELSEAYFVLGATPHLKTIVIVCLPFGPRANAGSVTGWR